MFHLTISRISFRLLFQILCVSLSVFSYMPEALTSEGRQIDLKIAKLPLSEALIQLIEQTKIHLLYESRLVKHLNSPSLTGLHTVENALALLLEGSDLSFKRLNRSMYIISRKSSAEQATSPALNTQGVSDVGLKQSGRDTLMPEVVVVGETHHTISLREPSTATKVFIPTMEVPRSLEGITAELLRDRGNATLAEAFRDYSSVNVIDETGLIYLRGFRIQDQSILKGGLPSISRGITSLSLQNIEGIEIAKGANSSLYGYGQPGGVINLIPKMPKSIPFTNLSVSYGNYDNYFAIDANNPLDLNERLKQRFDFLIRNEDRHNQGDGSIQQIQLTPTFVYEMDGDKTLSLNLEYNHQEIDGQWGKRLFDKTDPAYQPIFDFLFPNFTEVPYYPYSGSGKKDHQQSDSLDLWTKFKAPINNTWNYNLAAYVGHSEIAIRSLFDLNIGILPFNGFKNVDKIDLYYKLISNSDYLCNLCEKFEDHFFSTYGDQYAENIDVIQAIYGDTTTPGWSDDKIRFYQMLGDLNQDAMQFGFDINTHSVLDLHQATHDLVAGFSYVQRQWQYNGLTYYSGELYDKGTDFIENDQLVTGFGLRRFSQLVWYYPYGPNLENVDIIVPDQLAMQANLPSNNHYLLDRKQSFYLAEISTKSLGFYLQDHISLGEKWRLLLASGFYRFQRNFYNNLSNEFANLLINERWSLTAFDQSYIDDNLSHLFGLVYLPTDELSFYVSHGNQFDIVNGQQMNGIHAEPEKTQANELGIKWWPLEEFNISASRFEITKENYLFPGENNNGFGNIQQDVEIKSTGGEINLTGYITPKIKLSTNYYKFRANYVGDPLEIEGLSRLTDVPQESGSFWLQYQTQSYGNRGWTIGAGLNYVGKRISRLYFTTFDLDSYLLADAAVTYKNEDFRIVLNIDNIQNKKWLVGSSAKGNPVPEFAYREGNSGFSSINVAMGYGTRVRLTTELYF